MVFLGRGVWGGVGGLYKKGDECLEVVVCRRIGFGF